MVYRGHFCDPGCVGINLRGEGCREERSGWQGLHAGSKLSSVQLAAASSMPHSGGFEKNGR
jgi:hypothetical protein